MRTDAIEAVGIDEHGSLWVKPATATFQYIYREAMEVHWDAERRCLYGPKPRERSYSWWFKRITDAARQQEVQLSIAPWTSWSGVHEDLRQAITGGGEG